MPGRSESRLDISNTPLILNRMARNIGNKRTGRMPRVGVYTDF